jgi:TetR/AcrR family fatty acid metabolism transcriptional regulator
MNRIEKNKPRARLEQREADIIQAATTLFASDGFHATSTRKIAAAAGVSEGTVFHYFSTKNALLLAILDGFYEELIESAREGVQNTMNTRERLLLLANNHLRALMENQAIMARLIQVYLSVDINYYLEYKNSHLHQLNYRYTRIFDNVISEGIERGYLDPKLELPAIRDLFFGGLEYGMRTLLGKKNTRGLNSYVEKIVDPLWHSMQLVTDEVPATGVPATGVPATGVPATDGPPDQRLQEACRRIERAAEKLELAAGRVPDR